MFDGNEVIILKQAYLSIEKCQLYLYVFHVMSHEFQKYNLIYQPHGCL